MHLWWTAAVIYNTRMNDMDCFYTTTNWLVMREAIDKRPHFMKLMIPGPGKHFRDAPKLWESQRNVTNHTKPLSSTPLMHVRRSWTCLWLRTINEKAHTGALERLLLAPPLITAYVTSWLPHALIRLLYAVRAHTPAACTRSLPHTLT